MDYKASYDLLVIDPAKIDDAHLLADRIKSFKDKYDEIEQLIKVPWYVTGVVHYRESSLNFKRHLHNGDPLTARTVHVPAGYPKTGNPPFTWVESAVDAFKLKYWHTCIDWSIENALNLIERYNGLGYKKKGLPSPYIWSWSNIYKIGKYVADGKFDPDVVDQQCGAAVLLKLLI
jgi:lysozyme family protein